MRPLLVVRFLRSLVVACALLVANSVPALAHNNYVAIWQGAYPASSSDDNVINGTGVACQLCHFNATGGAAWNAYGWRIHQNIQSGQTVLNAILNAAPLNSDLDPSAATNRVEITLSTQPGWTPGANNTEYLNSSTIPGLNPPGGILGSLDPASPLTHYCFPGVGSVLACPCSNAPAIVGLGCNNSDNTGGASIGAVGAPSIAADTLVFTTYGQKATATTVLLQGTAQNATGVVFGQGIRCVAGSLKRLYVKPAAAGSFSAPASGDPSVSARSAALGDVLAAGLQREYMAYYRDPTVQGGCPATSTFNATSAGFIVWLP